jgi:hypothetical protein
MEQTATTRAPMDQVQAQRYVNLAMNFGRGILVLICAVMLVSVLHPDVRSQMRGLLAHDFRQVVSVAEGDLAGGGSHYKVAKIKTRDTLSLEVYQILGDGQQKLVEKIDMPDQKDGYFNFNGNATNLAIDDIDGDGKAEILAPSFDKNLVGKLNVYHLDPEGGMTERAMR